MKDTALLIMAAGIGSRFGGGIKQLEPVGPGGEIIMDYSIHDAMEAVSYTHLYRYSVPEMSSEESQLTESSAVIKSGFALPVILNP